MKTPLTIQQMHITTTAALHSMYEHVVHIGTHKLVKRLTVRYEMMCMCPLAHEHTLSLPE